MKQAARRALPGADPLKVRFPGAPDRGGGGDEPRATAIACSSFSASPAAVWRASSAGSSAARVRGPDLVPDARQHRKEDPAGAVEFALDAAEEKSRPAFGAVPGVDQGDAQQQSGWVGAAMQVRDDGTRVRERFVMVAAHGVRTHEDVEGMADSVGRPHPPQRVDRRPQPGDRGVEPAGPHS